MNNDWLDIELLEDYLDGKLDGAAMHKIEKQALEDPFVAQALAGLSASPKRASHNVSLLQKQLHERIGQHQLEKKKTVYTWQRLSVAAAAAVMFISVSIIFFMREQAKQTELSKNKTRKVEINIAPSADTVAVATGDNYATVRPDVSSSPRDIGMISPRRRMEDKPLQMESEPNVDNTAPVAAAVTSAGTDTIMSESRPRVAAAVANAKVSSLAPATSAPIGGWAALDSYIADHNKFNKGESTGKFVELSFLIDSDGNTSDIRIEKGASQEFDTEAIRLIKDGPKWEQPKITGARLSYTITF